MAVPPPFHVGISPDWSDWARDTLPTALEEVLRPLPGLSIEPMESSGEMTREFLDRHDAIIAFAHVFRADSINRLQRLCCIARWGVGFDTVDVDACTRSDVMVSLSPGAVRRPMAEGIITLMLSLAKNVHALDAQVRSGRWRENLRSRSICVRSRTLGSVGLGNIAGELFRIGRGMGFGRLLSFDPYAPPEKAEELGVELVSLETLLRESDFVAVNAPLNAETRNLIGARELALMKPTAYLINTSRGPLVNEAALLDALRAGRIAGAGLDVFEREPLPPGHPFYELDNVILTPHSVGWTEELIRDLNLETCQCVRAVYEGRVPETLANSHVVNNPGLQKKLAVRRPG